MYYRDMRRHQEIELEAHYAEDEAQRDLAATRRAAELEAIDASAKERAGVSIMGRLRRLLHRARWRG